MLSGRAISTVSRVSSALCVPRKALPSVHARAFDSFSRSAPKRNRFWIIGVGAFGTVAFVGTTFCSNHGGSKKEVMAEDLKKGKSAVDNVSGSGSAPVVPNAPTKGKIVRVLTDDEQRELAERAKAEKKAQEVLKEHSSHEKEDVEHHALTHAHREYPIEEAQIVFPPNVPPPINRTHPVRLLVNMNTYVKELQIDPAHTYDCWTFNGGVPGPFIRARKGDILEIHFRNEDTSGMYHNLDFHAVNGPGGGAPLLTAEQGQTKRACFKLLYPGLFVYHCAVDPIAVHVANGMYGAILVEPEEGLPHVDKEFAIVQSEFYAAPDDNNPDSSKLVLSYPDVQMSNPSHVVFNGRDGALTDEPLVAHSDSRVRLFFANAGPNLVSSFHVIGTIFDKLYREGDFVSPPARGIQSTAVAAGGAAVVEMKMSVPGTYSIVDHSLSRVEKGAVGYLNIVGKPRPDIYHGEDEPKNCPGCKIHP